MINYNNNIKIKKKLQSFKLKNSTKNRTSHLIIYYFAFDIIRINRIII